MTTLLGVSLGSAMTPLGAAEALFLAPLGGLGADVHALGEAYREAMEDLPSHLDIFNSAGKFPRGLDQYRKALRKEDWKSVHDCQMKLTDCVRDTPHRLWERIVENLQTKRGWALQGGIFATAQNPVMALREILGVKNVEGLRVTTDDFDQLSAEIYRNMWGRNRDMRRHLLSGYDITLEDTSEDWANHVFDQNFEGLPNFKRSIDQLRKAKAAFLRGEIVEVHLALMEGGNMGWGDDDEKMQELAGRLELRIAPEDRDSHYERVGKFLDSIFRRFEGDQRTYRSRIEVFMPGWDYEGSPAFQRDKKRIDNARQIWRGMEEKFTKEGLSQMVAAVAGCSDLYKSVLHPILTALHASFLEEAGGPVLKLLDDLQTLVERTFDEGRRKKGVLQRMATLKEYILRGNRVAARDSLIAIQGFARQEGADNVVGLVNDMTSQL